MADATEKADPEKKPPEPPKDAAISAPAGDATPRLTAALCAAIQATPWVEFTKPEKGGGINYDYLAEEDIVKALRKVLPVHGLAIVPRTMKLVSKEIYNSSNGGRMVNLLICVGYRVTHTSGEYIDGEALGEGSDRGDKAANKAMTGAFKYFLRELTLVAGGMDPDRTSSDELGRAAKDKGAKPAGGGQPAATTPTKTPEQRLGDALAHVAKQNTHDAIKKVAKQAGTVFKGDMLNKVYNACANRATLLFTAAVGKAADLEAIDAVVKAAEADKIGAENLKTLKAAAEKRAGAIVQTDTSGQTHDGGGDPDVEPLDF